ncbi:MAG TPA: HEAT repeat domain-containing protein [Anaerolineae bacterium]|nr:HEAT repeat domain-containing protein [Anaerolineae bacterium]
MRAIVGFLLVLQIAWLGGMAWYVWPRSEAPLTPGAVIVAHHPGLVFRAGLLLLALLCALTLVLFLSAARTRPIRRSSWVTLMPLQIALVFGLAAPVLVLLWLAYQSYCQPWRDIAQLQAADGKTYHVQVLGHHEILSEEVSRDQHFLRTRVIGRTHWRRWPPVGLPVARPAGEAAYDLQWSRRSHDQKNGRLVESRHGRWVVFLYPRSVWDPVAGSVSTLECTASLAYDRQGGEFYGGQTLSAVSPFILMGPHDDIKAEDVEVLLDMWRYDFNLDRTYDVQPVSQGAAHPNPAVRSVAAGMLGEYWDEDDTARAILEKLVDSDPNEEVRAAAHDALARLDERLGQRRAGSS